MNKNKRGHKDRTVKQRKFKPMKRFSNTGFITHIYFLVILGVILFSFRPCDAAQTVLYGLKAEGFSTDVTIVNPITGITSTINVFVEENVVILDADKDADGNIYVSGYFGGILTFRDGLTFQTEDFTQFGGALPTGFLAKLTSGGVWETAVTLGTEVPKKMIVKNGDIYLCSNTQVQRRNAAGLGMEDSAEMSGGLIPMDLVMDANDNVYVCGTYSSAATWGEISTPGPEEANGFIAKLDTGLNWKWVIQSYNPQGSAFKGMTVDGSNNLYTIGNQRGLALSEKFYLYYLAPGLSPLTIHSDTNYLNNNRIIIKLAPDGSLLDQDKEDGFGDDILFANNRLYIIDGGLPVNNPKRISSLNLSLGSKTNTASIFSTGVPLSQPILELGDDGNIYIAGKFDYSPVTFKNYNGIGWTERFSLETSKGNVFIAQMDSSMEWQWAKILACGSGDEYGQCAVEPDELALSALSPGSNTNIVAGAFKNGTLVVGDDPPDASMTAGEGNAGYLAIVDNEGNFARRYTLTLKSELNGESFAEDKITLKIDGVTVATELDQENIYASGTHINITAPDSVSLNINGEETTDPNQTVTKIFFSDYEATGIPDGAANPCDFTLSADTTVKYNWETRHALIIVQDFTNAPGLTSDSAGSPDPGAGTHWDYVAGELVTPKIDGYITDPLTPGTRYNVTGYKAEGFYNTALEALAFDGENDFAAVQSLNVSSEFTLSFYARILQENARQTMVSHGSMSVEYTDENRMRFTVGGNSVETPDAYTGDDRWHHWAFVCGFSQMEIYLDGERVAVNNVSSNYSYTGQLRMGCSSSNTHYFKGVMDEFRLWPNARTATEINNNRKITPVSGANTLLLYFLFDDPGTGSTILGDSGGYNRNGVLYNFDLSACYVLSTAPMYNTTDSSTFNNADAPVYPFASIQENQQIQQFSMDNPVRITYRWEKQCRLQVSTSTFRAANLPIVEAYNADGTVDNERTRYGSGDFWFQHGVFLNIRSQTSNIYEFVGYTNGLGSVTPIEKTFEDGDDRVVRFVITEGSSLTLEYGQSILKMTVDIGNPVSYSGSDEPYKSQLNWSVKPAITLVDSPPGSTVDDMMVWDDVANKIYPLRPGKTLLEWDCSGIDCPEGTAVTQIESRFPGMPHYRHIAETPPVNLDPAIDDAMAFKELKYTTSDAVVTQAGELTSPRSGYSVLMFSESTDPGRPANGDLTQEKIRVRVVGTKAWYDEIHNLTADIGTPITSPFHASELLAAGMNGYVFWENARYNPYIYDRETCTGPIVPVNRQFTSSSEDDLVVIWYAVADAIAWPSTAARYICRWPSTKNRIVIAGRLGTEGKNTDGVDQLKFEPPRYKQVTVYAQPNPDQPGYNPNEEHAVVKDAYMNDGVQRSAVFALRNDLNVTLHNDGYTSDPYVLVQYYDNQAATYKMAVYSIEKTDAGLGYVFEYPMVAGQMIKAPYPLDEVIGLTVPEEIYGVDGQPDLQKCYWEDKNQQGWAVSGGTYVKIYFYYPLQPGFWYNKDHDGDGEPDGPGQIVPWLPPEGFANDTPVPVEVIYTVEWPDETPILKAGETVTFSGGEYKTDHPEAKGLDGILGWASGRIIFDGQNPTGDPNLTLDAYTVRLIAPLLERSVSLAIEDIPEDFTPAKGGAEVVGTRWYFENLHAGLKKRIYYDTMTEKLGIRGFVNDKTLGDDTLTAAPPALYCLQPNILTRDELETLKGLEGVNDSWRNAADTLYRLCRDLEGLDRDETDGNIEYTLGLIPFVNDAGTPVPEQAIPKHQLGPGLALATNLGLLDPAVTFDEGYVTLVQNNHEDVSGPIALSVIKVVNEKFRGGIQVVLTDNVFDEKVTLRHTGDFGGNPDDLVFEWYYREDDGSNPEPPDIAPAEWLKFGEPVAGRMEISIAGTGKATLVDNLFYVRYRHKNAVENAVSDWAGDASSRPGNYSPQLLMGWVKRVRDAINPYEARVQDFRNADAPATYASMIQQAGQRYEGPVALNTDQDVIENVGLIELYQTVMDRARSLSIDRTDPATSPGVRNTLLLAASMISDLYVLLGNEAFTDAQDPTIGYGTNSTEYGNLAPTIFTFQNQLPNLLSEELALLRGTETTGARPTYNRLIWNFTKGQGEAAYALSYNVTDVNKDGFIDETDGRILYPQGHGDAWGHYLTALKTYYQLLRHPYFDWESRSELYNIEGVVIDVDYYDERKFAQIAADKARTGREIMNLTYRSRYVEDPEGQWQGYTDTDRDREWGVTGWARRAGQGAYLDWLTANAIIPSKDEDPTHTGLKKIDRTTVAEIQEINALASDIRRKFEDANTGLTPLGLAVYVVPFDIDTSYLNREYTDCRTHFEQIYDRALDAMQNALRIFDYANEIGNMLRQNAVSVDNFRMEVAAQDLDYRNRLIEIFGTPYAGTIGPGKPYPAGYVGPDYMQYNYVDTTDVSNETVPPPSTMMKAFFEPGNFWVEAPEEDLEENDDLAMAYRHFFDEDMAEGAVVDADFSQILEVDFPISTADYAFQAPEEWGSRKSPGEIQQVLSELVQAEADLMFALGDYTGHMAAITDAIDLLEAKSNQIAETVSLKTAERNTAISLNSLIMTAKATSGALNLSAEFIADMTSALSEACPKTTGTSNDVTSAARSSLKFTGALSSYTLKTAAFAAEQTAEGMALAKDINAIVTALEVEEEGYKYEIKEQLKAIKALLGDEAPKRVAIFKKQEAMRQVSEKYRAVLEKGLRLIEERRRFNAKTAAVTQRHRYQDMTFRVSRNDALQKYRASFDLAAQYVYLAAKTYDYETNLSPNDPGSSRPLLTSIVKQRTLGQFDDGVPIAGQGGLADILARLDANYAVLKNQMGFSNPQMETGRFSLRTEYQRLDYDPGANGDAADDPDDDRWRQYLAGNRVDNLWDIPEFPRYCRPFAPRSAGAQPGIVLTFPTSIIFGYNVFGRELQAGDHAYDPTHFTTKIRSVSAWFDNYDGQGLSLTPRVYLIPVGFDVMIVPTSDDLDVREWNVVDQRLPVPLPAGQSDLENPDYIPILDSLDGTFWEIRRFSSFRAYHDVGYIDVDQMTTDSRLVGRSVWNTNWMLIIPGGTLLHDPDEGLDTFIYGQRIPGAPEGGLPEEIRDLNGVKDIKLFFETYAISGN